LKNKKYPMSIKTPVSGQKKSSSEATESKKKAKRRPIQEKAPHNP